MVEKLTQAATWINNRLDPLVEGEFVGSAIEVSNKVDKHLIANLRDRSLATAFELAGKRIATKAGTGITNPEKELSPELAAAVKGNNSQNLGEFLSTFNSAMGRFYANIIKLALIHGNDAIINTFLTVLQPGTLEEHAKELCDLALEKDSAELCVKLLAAAYAKDIKDADITGFLRAHLKRFIEHDASKTLERFLETSITTIDTRIPQSQPQEKDAFSKLDLDSSYGDAAELGSMKCLEFLSSKVGDGAKRIALNKALRAKQKETAMAIVGHIEEGSKLEDLLVDQEFAEFLGQEAELTNAIREKISN